MDTTIAGPAPTWPESPEIAVPMAAKIPAPMTAPMPSAVSWRGREGRLSHRPTALSAMHWPTVLRRRSCALDKERRQHQRDRAQELDQHVQRRPRRVLERIAHRVADHGRLVGQTALPAVFTRLDEFLGVVPRATTVVEQRGHEDPRDRADHEERRHRLGADMEQQLEDQSHGDRHAHGDPTAATSSRYAENSRNAARAAEPIAYPLVSALVVLPTASSRSVRRRMSSG